MAAVKESTKEKVDFKEVGRISVSDSTQLVVSTVTKGGKVTGYNINKYITSNKYTGFTKGNFLPKDQVEAFKKLLS